MICVDVFQVKAHEYLCETYIYSDENNNVIESAFRLHTAEVIY